MARFTEMGQEQQALIEQLTIVRLRFIAMMRHFYGPRWPFFVLHILREHRRRAQKKDHELAELFRDHPIGTAGMGLHG